MTVDLDRIQIYCPYHQQLIQAIPASEDLNAILLCPTCRRTVGHIARPLDHQQR